MPRGYLKHKSRAVGKKAARGGGSGFPGYGDRWYHPKESPRWRVWRHYALFNDDLVDWHNMAEGGSWFADDLENDEENEFSQQQVKKDEETCYSVHTFSRDDETETNGRDEQSSMSFVAVSEVYSFSLCEEGDESVITGFSLIGEEEEDSVTTTTSQKLVTVVVDKRATEEDSFIAVGPCETDSVSCVTLPSSKATQAQANLSAVCAICLEEKSLIRVMNKCLHPLACFDCLRTHYVVNAQKDVANYPLRCFWPGCDRILRDVQVRRFVESYNELQKHYEMEVRAKNIRRLRLREEVARCSLLNRRVERLKTVYSCPGCSCHNVIQPFDKKVSTCTKCSLTLVMDALPREEIMSVMKAVGDNLVNCPACSAIIVKEEGCDHMTCVCESEFSFAEARRKLDK